MTNFTKLFVMFLLVTFTFTSSSFALKAQKDEYFFTQKNKAKFSKRDISKNIFSEKKKRVKGVVKSDSPNEYAKFQNMIRTRDGESKPAYLPNYQLKELNLARKNLKLAKGNAQLDWVERGPGNVSGRTRGLIVDISDPTHNTWLAGSVGGGVWKTTDAGLTWDNKTNDIPNLATTVLVQSKSNPDIIYCGTGEGFYNADAVNGNGIFKSTDHGNTWTQLLSTTNFDFYCVNRMIVDPVNANIVIACTNPGPSSPAGIYRSNDGGTSWTRVYDSGNFRVQDLRVHPNNFLLQYAAVEVKGVFTSTDGGLSWNKTSEGLNAGGRIEIAISPVNPDVLFASAEMGTGSGLFISYDGAITWNLISNANGSNPNWLNGQGWYDNTIEAHPYKENTVFFGGIDVWKAEVLPIEVKMNITDILIDSLTFMGFNDWNGSFKNSGIGLGVDFYNTAPFQVSDFNLNENDYVSVELRFGPGKNQKAHRFVAAANGDYEYKDYVTVPFEVWDISNNKQIMVSFRDTQNDGAFDLKSTSKEYISVNAIDYNAVDADANIAIKNGIIYKNIFTISPKKGFGVTWDPNNLPNSFLRINYGLREEPPTANFYNVTDGYSQYQKPYVHVDHHNIVMIPIDQATEKFWILNGNDGGVAISTNQGSTWREALSGGYNTTQFYGADKKPGGNEFIGGTQDNGTWLSPKNVEADKTTAFRRVIGGDGFDVIWNYKNPSYIIGGSQFNNFYRSTDGGTSWGSAVSGLTDAGSGKGCFISKLVTSQSDPGIIYTTGSEGVWRSENFGDTWFKCNVKESDWYFNGTSTPIAVSIADPRIIWAGCWHTYTQSNLVFSQDGGVSFNSVNGLTEATQGWITGIDTHPIDLSTAYLTYSAANAPKILRTTDFGQNWEDISGFGTNSTSGNGFPNVATYCVVVMPYNTNIIWAGTEIGLFESTDGGVSWHYLNNGLPAVSIWDMKIVDDQVVLATHGRGIFSVTLNELQGITPPVVTLSPLIQHAGQGPDGIFSMKLSLRSQYDSTLVMVDNKRFLKLDTTNPTDTIISSTPPVASGKISVQVISYRNNKVYKTFVREAEIFQIKQAEVKYVNSFDSASQDFVGNDFTITQPTGFTSPAIHSLHPYLERTEYYYSLLVPIKVAAENAFVEYDDIAIVEPGEAGTVFGDTEFWDYVVLEGSKDGINWTPISDGYDCRYNADWKQIYDQQGAPNSSNFVHHKINLLDKFSAGDQILLRLYLFSDPYTVGWGWVLDNLSIQNNVVDVSNKGTIPLEFGLSQNYPNPFNPTTKIKYNIPYNGKSEMTKVQLIVYDILGNEVSKLVNENKAAGEYEVEFDGKNISSGIYFYMLNVGENRISRKMSLIK